MNKRRKQPLVRPKEVDTHWENFHKKEVFYQDYEFPKVAIIVPTYNCGQLISWTMESLLNQNYPDFEIVIVDAGSDDKTIEIVKGYRDDRVFVYTVSNNQRYEMLNKGISQTNAAYVNFLFPGDYYLYNDVLKTMMTLALDYAEPSLLFCSTLLRDPVREPKILYRHLSLSYLRKGKQPTSLQSCWFHVSVFEEIGKFNTTYTTRGGYDLLCRYCLHGGLRTMSTSRVLTDYSIRVITRKDVLTHFRETFRAVFKNFGFYYSLRWLFFQNDIFRFMKLWWNSLKLALLGRKY